MSLVPLGQVMPKTQNENERGLGKLTWKNYLPLLIIIAAIFVTSLILAPNFELRIIMRNFMVGFFVIFSAFKLLDLKGFAEGYSTYDLLAKRWFAYGYVYPFIELFFGFAMLLGLWERQILVLEIVVMTFSGIGVALKLAKGEKFQCVCLGTFLKVPLTKVTLVEDFGMAVLAGVLLVLK